MNEWSVVACEQFDRDIKRMMKRYKRETTQMLANLQTYQDSLQKHDNPLLMVEYSFVHREASGCHALTQQPLKSSTQTRLYLYCYITDHEIHLICAGDKQSQQKDNQYCRNYVQQLQQEKSY